MTPEIAAALAHFAITPRRVVLISPLRERKGSRYSYRVDAQDGRVVKLRQLNSSERARRLLQLRTGLEAAFAPALAHHGRVLLEEWIDGAALSDADAAARAEEAGALLGRLHATALDSAAHTTRSTSERSAEALSNLEILYAAGQLAPSVAAALRAEIARRDPGTARAVLIHLDFCAENMLIDTRGRLRVIDNELLMIAPAGFDLGRTFDRWPMSAALLPRV
jgi:aminoglycoside phosphotransferase (APT) family kinase protein